MTPTDDDRRLLSLLVHELRSPAAVVSGYLRLLLKDDAAGGVPERARHMIEEANRSCARVLHLVREIAVLADLAERDLHRSSTPVRIFSLCDEVVQAAVRPEAGSVAFTCDGADQPALVRGDESRLKEALAALVAATLREHGAKPLEIYGVVDQKVDQKEGAAQAVIVFGEPGIAERREDVLTARERSFNRWRGGTGLSVPIASRIVEMHGGRLWSPTPASRADCALSLPIDVP